VVVCICLACGAKTECATPFFDDIGFVENQVIGKSFGPPWILKVAVIIQDLWADNDDLILTASRIL
jgi:hypothetical protein